MAQFRVVIQNYQQIIGYLGEFMGERGEGNGTPLQYFCLENPMDGGAWWAAICGVAQTRTRLKRLSSSSSSIREWGMLFKDKVPNPADPC